MMSLLLIPLSVLVGGTVVILLIGRRRWRARPVPVRASLRRRLNATTRSLATARTHAAAHDPLTMELSVWRPLPRQELMRRQATLRHAAAKQDAKGSANPDPIKRRILRTQAPHCPADPAPVIDTPAAPDAPCLPECTASAAVERACSLSLEGACMSRIGRKRAGLETLITDSAAAEG